MVARSHFAALGLIALVGCTGTVVGMNGGFKDRYSVARDSLETGNYKTATRNYKSLVSEYRDPEVATRLNLELAHSLLRQGNYAEAAETARVISSSQQGEIRAMALAVSGTAEHEIGRERIAKGDYGPETRQHLMAAAVALDDMLKNFPKLDEGHAMERRRALLRNDLAAVR